MRVIWDGRREASVRYRARNEDDTCVDGNGLARRNGRRIVVMCMLVVSASGLSACDGSHQTPVAKVQHLPDHMPSPTNWTVAQSGRSGGRSWRLLRGTDKGQECFRFETKPALPYPTPLVCDRAANLVGDNGGSPMALEIADAGHGAGYVYGGVAPELRTITMHHRDTSTLSLEAVNRTLVTYATNAHNIARMSFATGRSSGDCITGTGAATFNCSWSGP